MLLSSNLSLMGYLPGCHLAVFPVVKFCPHKKYKIRYPIKLKFKLACPCIDVNNP